MMDSITQATLSLAQSAGLWGYWFSLLAALTETAFLLGMLVPGSALLLLMGMLAGQGVFDLGDLLFFAIVGATLGDNLNYFLGRRYGRQWLSQDRWFLKADHLRKAEAFFHDHGGKSVFLGRFVPSVKEIMPFIAGMAGMERRSFMVWNLAGAVGWSLQWILPGYLFSQSLSLAQAWLSRIGVVALILVLVLALIYGLRWSLLKYGSTGFQFVRSILQSAGTAVRQNPKVIALGQRFPATSHFMRQRFDRDRWIGLPLTLTSVCGLYLLVIFSGIAEDLVTGDAVTAIDARVNGLFASLRTPFFNQVFFAITSLGFLPLVISGTTALSFWLWYRRQPERILALAISVGSCELLTWSGKQMFHRPRPDGALLEPMGFSFPSGHASISVAFYGFSLYLAMCSVRFWRRRLNLLMLGLLVVFLIGFSRLYLGVHYFSDVVAGYLVGAMGLMLGISATYLRPFHGHWSGNKFRASPKLKLTGAASGLATFFALALVLNFGKPPLLAASYTQADQTIIQSSEPKVVLLDGSNQARSVFGEPEAPINVIFLANGPGQVWSCLRAIGWLEADSLHWRSVPNAYIKAFQGKDYPTAPLSPWFWGTNQQMLGLVLPGQQGRVFDRSFLRIWNTNRSLTTGEHIYVATVGEETRKRWHLVPQTLPRFNQARVLLARELGIGHWATEVSEVYDQPPHGKASNADNPPYDGGISVIKLATGCQ